MRLSPARARQLGLLPPGELTVQARRRESAEDHFARMAELNHLPPPTREALFAPGRKWRFDFAWPAWRVAVEIEGLVVLRGPDGALSVRGRHATVSGFRADCEKYNTAALLGWAVLRFEQGTARRWDAVDMTQRVLVARGWNPDQTAEVPYVRRCPF